VVDGTVSSAEANFNSVSSGFGLKLDRTGGLGSRFVGSGKFSTLGLGVLLTDLDNLFKTSIESLVRVCAFQGVWEELLGKLSSWARKVSGSFAGFVPLVGDTGSDGLSIFNLPKSIGSE
jgi:hypothetical protein